MTRKFTSKGDLSNKAALISISVLEDARKDPSKCLILMHMRSELTAVRIERIPTTELRSRGLQDIIISFSGCNFQDF